MNMNQDNLIDDLMSEKSFDVDQEFQQMQTVKDLIVPIDHNEEDEFKNNPYYLYRDPLINNNK